MPTPITASLEQLSTSFAVRDIMTPLALMERAATEQEARQREVACPAFDCFPLPKEGMPHSYWQRGASKVHPISPRDLISDGTTLLSLLELLSGRDFYFVLTSNAIAGFVHFSDLNNSLVKLPLFLLLTALEGKVSALAKNRFSLNDLACVVDPQRMAVLEQKLASATKARADRTQLDLLSFDELLRLGMRYGVVQIQPEECPALSAIRNRVMHNSGQLLIAKHADVHKVWQASQICLRLLGEDAAPIRSAAPHWGIEQY